MRSLAVVAAVAALIATAPAHAQKISLASTAPYTGVNKTYVDAFVAEMKTRVPGMTIDLFLEGKLGGEKELLEQLKLGETHIHLGVIHSALYYPELDATLMPYLFPDYASIQRYLAGPMGAKMNEALERKGGGIYLGTFYQGPRWTTSNKSFATLDELKGVKIRMPEIPIWIKIWGGLGAVITPIPSPEVYSALKTGVVDAQENMLSNILGRKIYEAQKFLIATRHQQAYTTTIAQRNWFRKLPADQQAALRAASAAADKAASEQAIEENASTVKKLQDFGLTLVEPKPEFRAKAMPVIEKVAKDVLAPGAWEAAVAAIEKK